MTDIVTSVPVPSNKVKPDIPIDVGGLEKSLRRPRTAFNYIISFPHHLSYNNCAYPVVLSRVDAGGQRGTKTES